jgi:hypothetical protein
MTSQARARGSSYYCVRYTAMAPNLAPYCRGGCFFGKGGHHEVLALRTAFLLGLVLPHEYTGRRQIHHLSSFSPQTSTARRPYGHTPSPLITSSGVDFHYKLAPGWPDCSRFSSHSSCANPSGAVQSGLMMEAGDYYGYPWRAVFARFSPAH